jgi:hypothetical protein
MADCRLLLHFNWFPFFGSLIIILEKMIKETAIFFLLLVVIAAGFFQSFASLAPPGNGRFVVIKMFQSMTQAFLNSPDFEYYEKLKPPFGITLFYLYTGIVSVRTSSPSTRLILVLLNILVALFNQAYSIVTGILLGGYIADYRPCYR